MKIKNVLQTLQYAEMTLCTFRYCCLICEMRKNIFAGLKVALSVIPLHSRESQKINRKACLSQKINLFCSFTIHIPSFLDQRPLSVPPSSLRFHCTEHR